MIGGIHRHVKSLPVLWLALGLVLAPSGAASAGSDRVVTTSHSTYRLVPRMDRVEVVVLLSITNRKRDRVVPCPGATTRSCRQRVASFVDHWPFVVQDGARRVRFAGPGVVAAVDYSTEFGLTKYRIDFSGVAQGDTRRIRVTYRLPASRPESPRWTRITEAYAHFCWQGQPTDRGTVKAIVPRRYEPTTFYETVDTAGSPHGVVIQASSRKHVDRFFACTDAVIPDALLHRETMSPSGQKVIIEGWPEDPDWTARVAGSVALTLPRLEDLAGSPLPYDGIVIRQVASQALFGYLGEFDGKHAQIRLEERTRDRFVVAHELAHAWVNSSSMAGLWMIEGSAEWLAHAANDVWCPALGRYPGKGSFSLRPWRFLGPASSVRRQRLVGYQYPAACRVYQRLEKLAGIEVVTDILGSLLDRAPKYGGTLRPDPPKPDWREWLDAVDEIGLVPAGVSDLEAAERLVVDFGIARPEALRGRAAARARYHEALSGPLGEAMPVLVRDLMDDWRFAKARKAMVLADEILQVARARSDADPNVWLRVRDTTSMSELKRLHHEAASESASP